MILKRIFDVVVSSLGLLVLAPLLLALLVWIKLDSRGPALFRQQRVGRGGRIFQIHKFRTMTVDAERAGPQITSAADPRITRCGAFLRRFKLDELPQLWDVVTGNMSLVGPRPEVPRYMDMYPRATRELVLSVRPGITDWASVQFRDEGRLLAASSEPERTYIEEVLPIKQQLYLDYVQKRSFFVDLKILALTLSAVFRRT